MFEVQKIRESFPALQQKVHGKDFIYFDTAATALKPKAVADRISHHYLYEASNVHRGLHFLSDQATENFERVRKQVQNYIGAQDESEIIFTRGTTDSLNLLARSFGKAFLRPGDEILISDIEHHSNIVPWQMLCEDMGCQLKTFTVNIHGKIDLDNFKENLSRKTKLVSITMVSNALGIILPVEEIIKLAHDVGAKVALDAAQAIPHQKINVQKLNCDFLAFSAHKLYGPTGVGVLYGRSEQLDQMPPVYGGGGMIDEVSFLQTTYLKSPFRFEAGTPDIAGVIAFGAAIDFMSTLDMEAVVQHEKRLTDHAQTLLAHEKEVQVFGISKNKDPIISFFVPGLHPSDIGTLLDQEGIAVRCGHHCTQPLMRRLEVSGTIRASFGMYNTEKEIEHFVQSLRKVIRILKG